VARQTDLRDRARAEFDLKRRAKSSFWRSWTSSGAENARYPEEFNRCCAEHLTQVPQCLGPLAADDAPSWGEEVARLGGIRRTATTIAGYRVIGPYLVLALRQQGH
jgi:hypothetical protein